MNDRTNEKEISNATDVKDIDTINREEYLEEIFAFSY